MTRIQEKIIELLAGMPIEQRREIVEHIRRSSLLEETFYDPMSPEQRAHLQDGAAEADRGQGEDASLVMDRLARKFGVSAE